MTPVIAPDLGADQLNADGDRIAAPQTESPPPPADRAPKRRPGRPKKAAKAAITDTQLRDALTELLCAPAIPFGMAGMAWPAEHVANAGPQLATQMVELGKVSPQFRGYLERAITGQAPIVLMLAVYMLGMAGAAYIVPLLAYFGVVPKSLGVRFGGSEIPDPPSMPPPADSDGSVVST